jgi:hypothetical protein
MKAIRRHVLLIGAAWLCLISSAIGQSSQVEIQIPESIPIFPLQDIMLFPGASRPLHIFEPRYRDMIADAMEGDRIIGMVMLKPNTETNYDGNPPIYEIGCAGILSNIEQLPDGRYNVIVQGLKRFRITGEDQRRTYRIASINVLDEVFSEADRATLRAQRPLLLELLSSVTPGQKPTVDEISDDLLVNGLAQFLGMNPADRLDLLQQEGPLARSDALLSLLDQGALSR